MDGYPSEYLAPCVPLYVLAGVDAPDELIRTDYDSQRQGSRIGPDQPTAIDERSRNALKAFLDLDVSADCSYPVPERSRIPPVAFRAAKARYTLPARKASPQASPAEPGPDAVSPLSPQNNPLHSPLSPLSSGSPLFVDGIMTPLWNAKYLALVPSIFIAFYSLSSDPNNDSLNDNRLKNDISIVRQSVVDSRYRTRFVAVLVAAGPTGTSSEVEERLSNIRSGARLDSTSLFFLPQSVDTSDLRAFAADVCSSLRPLSNEFYRDLTKHARRKRDKGANPVPPPQAGKAPSNGITRSGWVSRYEYKLGIFAEFRSEPDVAERHYMASLNALFDAQGPFEALSSWSPRFNQARTYADTAFLRLIRCQLQTGNPTSAVRSWLRHRDTMRDFIGRKGKGTGNYGWAQWESRWPRAMAELIGGSNITFPKSAPYADVENFVVQENQQLQISLSPWEHLHHAGYWQKLAATNAEKRKKMAAAIPDEDRVPPGQSPASRMARRSDLYDSYMAMEPHAEWQASQEPTGQHSTEAMTSLKLAAEYFRELGQARQGDQVTLAYCRNLIEMSKLDDAAVLLRSATERNSWRSEGWIALLQRLAKAIYDASSPQDQPAERLSSLWELHSGLFTVHPDVRYDIRGQMQSLQLAEALEVNVTSENVLSFLQISVNFGVHEARAGELLDVQLVLKSNAHAGSTPIQLDSITVKFEGTLADFEVTHDTSVEGSNVHSLDFGSQRASLGAPMAAKGNLKLAPGALKVLNAGLVPSEAGTVAAASATAVVREGQAMISFTQNLRATTTTKSNQWWIADRSGSLRPSYIKHRISRPVKTVKVLPRPPKMDIALLDLRHVCYTDERNTVRLQLTNKEEEPANVSVQIMAMSDDEKSPLLSWVDGPTEQQPREGLIDLDMGMMSAAEAKTARFTLHSDIGQTELMIEARVTYTLLSNPDVSITKEVSQEIAIIQPFEVKHRVRPDYHPDAWPSYFSVDDLQNKTTDTASGITFRYRSETQLLSFATDSLLVEKVELSLENATANARVKTFDFDEKDRNFEVQANVEERLVKCRVDVQRADLDERKAVVVDPVLNITWRRARVAESEIVLTKMVLPPLTLATSEPRALARRCDVKDSRIVAVEYVVENPSAHFLTFNYNMDPAEGFAFSGPKSASVQLTPLSRTSVRYVLTPFEAVKEINPRFHVVDAYFNKVLAVSPTGDLKDLGDGLAVPCNIDGA